MHTVYVCLSVTSYGLIDREALCVRFGAPLRTRAVSLFVKCMTNWNAEALGTGRVQPPWDRVDIVFYYEKV